MANRLDGLDKSYPTNIFEIVKIDGVDTVKWYDVHGNFFLVDINDWKKIKNRKWSMETYGYWRRGIRLGNKHKIIKMHRLILGVSSGVCVDHINNLKNDNRRCNLRLASKAQNGHNRPKLKINTSGYKGVSSYGKNNNRWRASIKANGKSIRVNGFANSYEAAIAYNFLAKHHHKDFCFFNNVNIL